MQDWNQSPLPTTQYPVLRESRVESRELYMMSLSLPMRKELFMGSSSESVPVSAVVCCVGGIACRVFRFS